MNFSANKPSTSEALVASTWSATFATNVLNLSFFAAGTILHGFEFLFVRLAPIVFLTSVVGVVVTYKKR